MKRAFQVGIHYLIEIFLRHFHQQSVPGDPGVIYQDIKAPLLLDHGLDKGLAGCVIRHIALIYNCLPARFFDLCLYGQRLFF